MTSHPLRASTAPLISTLWYLPLSGSRPPTKRPSGYGRTHTRPTDVHVHGCLRAQIRHPRVLTGGTEWQQRKTQLQRWLSAAIRRPFTSP